MKYKFLFITYIFVFINLCISQTPLKVVSSNILFKIKNAGLTVEGKFTSLETEINFMPDNLKASTIKANVEVNTINTGIKSRDNHLKKEEYFDATKFPKIMIASSFFAKKGETYNGYFKLTIKGISKEITIPFTFENGVFKGEFSIDRRDFKVGGNSMIMGDKVSVQIELKT
jgi:polyisoprenoid-binding protein YceI